MSTDWREKEREFLTGLKADTGRDLAEWMRVIAAQNLPHRNDIIDWLRQQGFPFARASWLERVHHNAGRPIYCDPADLVARAVEAETLVEAETSVQRVAVGGGGRSYVVPAADFTAVSSDLAAKAERKAAGPAIPRLAAERIAACDDARLADDVRTPTAVTPEAEAAPAQVAEQPLPAASHEEGGPPAEATVRGGVVFAPATADPLALDEVLAKAKAYRPLAQHLLKAVASAVPSLELGGVAGHIGLSAGGRGFGLIAVGARDIRLALRLDTIAEQPGLGPVKLPVTLSRAAQGLTHMAVLDDVRQIDEGLINLVRRAAGV